MARVELDLPASFPFTTRLAIRIGDINYGGHLGNDAVLALAQEARLRFLVSHGFADEREVGGLGLIMADAVVVYRAEGRYGMELQIDLALSDVRSRSFDVLYRLGDAADGSEIARVKTGLVWFDYATRKVARMPEAFARIVPGAVAAGAAPG
jgi:acyl-CoA thioester hydrolase